MRIKLHDNYQNASGVRLAPGEYDSTDERLQGLAGYLIKTEHASLVSDTSFDLESVEDTEIEDDADRDEEDAEPEDPIHRLARSDANTLLRGMAQLDTAQDIPDGLPLTGSERAMLEAKTHSSAEPLAYDTMTVADLRALAKERGLNAPSSLKHAELVGLLKGEA